MQLDVDRQDINTAEMRDVERPMSQNISAAAGGENDDDENVPGALQEYIDRHNFDAIVNQVVNSVLKERPTDPVQTIA